MKLNIEVTQRTPLRVIARRRAGVRRRIRVLARLGWEHMSDELTGPERASFIETHVNSAREYWAKSYWTKAKGG